jgi:hypothetical protein
MRTDSLPFSPGSRGMPGMVRLPQPVSSATAAIRPARPALREQGTVRGMGEGGER